MTVPSTPYYRDDLALVHHKGFAFHAEACAPGILALLDPIRQRNGLVLEIGCGSGLLTERLIGAGHRVVATDASPAMLSLAREVAAGAEEFLGLTLPDDAIPKADAIVGVGHALKYLPSRESIDLALVNLARSLLPEESWPSTCAISNGEPVTSTAAWPGSATTGRSSPASRSHPPIATCEDDHLRPKRKRLVATGRRTA